jgi:hypothetical protein
MGVNMSVVSNISTDKLELPRLVCVELPKRIQGIYSVGIGSLMTEDAESFLRPREKNISAFLVVLEVTAPPGSFTLWNACREKTKHLQQCWEQFFSHFLEMTRWRTLSASKIRSTGEQMGSLYQEMLDTLREISRLLDLDLEIDQSGQIGRELTSGMVDLLLKDVEGKNGSTPARKKSKSRRPQKQPPKASQ